MEPSGKIEERRGFFFEIRTGMVFTVSLGGSISNDFAINLLFRRMYT